MDLETFKTLPPERQREVLAERRQRTNAIIQELAREEIVFESLEAQLVPRIPLKKTENLPPVPDRDSAVRQLMAGDNSIEAVITKDGVKYLR